MNEGRIFHRGDRVYRFVITPAGTFEPQPLVVSRVRWRSATVRTTTGATLRVRLDDIYPPFGVLSPERHALAWGGAVGRKRRRFFRWRARHVMCASCGEGLRADRTLGYVHAEGRLVGADGHWVAPIASGTRVDGRAVPLESRPSSTVRPVA
jgi:hypothetical protein